MEVPLKPKSFKIGARTIKFKRGRLIDKGLEAHNFVGMSNYATEEIHVKSGQSEHEEQTTNWHEIVHIILKHMRLDELNKDEQFVDGFAEHLYQVLKTLK